MVVKVYIRNKMSNMLSCICFATRNSEEVLGVVVHCTRNDSDTQVLFRRDTALQRKKREVLVVFVHGSMIRRQNYGLRSAGNHCSVRQELLTDFFSNMSKVAAEVLPQAPAVSGSQDSCVLQGSRQTAVAVVY